MWKSICIGLVIVVTANAGKRTISITSGQVLGGIKHPAVTVENNKDKTDITWNSDVNTIQSPLRATLELTLKKVGKSVTAELENLCDKTEAGTKNGNAQRFILKAIANQDKCPIKKGTKSTFSVPFNASYNADNNPYCGPFRMEMKVFKKSDKGTAHPIIQGTFRGEISGC